MIGVEARTLQWCQVLAVKDLAEEWEDCHLEHQWWAVEDQIKALPVLEETRMLEETSSNSSKDLVLADQQEAATMC